MTNPFKVGDRIRRKTNGYWFIPVGHESIVTHRAGRLYYTGADGSEIILDYANAKFFTLVAPAPTDTPSDERRQLRDLRKAACALYLEGKWVIDEETDAADLEAQAKLWADLRDALGFKPGFNTTVSVKA